MGAQQRVFRRKIKSVQSTKKITKAMEMIASSRIVKAQRRLQNAVPYQRALLTALSAAASHATGLDNHPLTAGAADERRHRAVYLVITADRGLAGAYSVNSIRAGERLTKNLREEWGFKEVIPYVVGRKGAGYYRFREREIGKDWLGISDQPTFADAKEIASTLLERFLQPTDEGGTDEIHIVYTHFINMAAQETRVLRILPLKIVEEEVDISQSQVGGEGNEGNQPVFPLYDFEPSANAVLDELLPRYVQNAVYTALLMSAASEHAARRKACKSASDNAEELVKTYVRMANQARQAEITQEISEIVGGADALSSANAGS
jgi:F-type H+-transporting ATPase subunit gamma